MSFDFIPLEIYTPFFYYILVLVVVITYAKLQKGFVSNTTGAALLIFVILYIGLRPISGMYFGDMGTYNRYFEEYQNGGGHRWEK